MLTGSIVVRQFTQLGARWRRALPRRPRRQRPSSSCRPRPEGRPEFDDLDHDGEYDPGALLKLENWVNRKISPTPRAVGAALDDVRMQLVSMLGSLARRPGT